MVVSELGLIGRIKAAFELDTGRRYGDMQGLQVGSSKDNPGES